MLVAIGIAVLICGCQPLRSLDQLRTDFIALRYVKIAEAAVTDGPPAFAQAARSLDRALALAPDHQLVLARAGTLYVIAEAYNRAIPVLLKAQRITGAGHYYELGTCYLRTGDETRGIAYLERSVQLASHRYRHRQLSALGYATVLNNVGYIYADAGVELHRAKWLIEQAVHRAPLIASFTDSTGWVCFRFGDYHNAAFYLERAARQSLDSPNPEIHYHLGTTYARQNRLAEARQHLQKALELRPHYPAARDELRLLHRQLSPPWRANVAVGT